MDALVSTDWLDTELGSPDLRVVDATWLMDGEGDAAAAFEQAHIPGAVFMDLNELADSAHFLFASRPLEMDGKAAALLQGEAPHLLAAAHARLSGLGEWTAEATEQAVREVAEGQGVKLGQVAQPLRAALTGRATSPGIFDVLALLGREESLARIADQARKGQ